MSTQDHGAYDAVKRQLEATTRAMYGEMYNVVTGQVF